MKRLFMTLAVILLLTGCSDKKVNENISERMADDTYQVLEIMDKAVKNEGKVSDKEQKVLDAYVKTYETKELTAEESKLYEATELFIFIKDEYSDLKSDQEQYKIGRQNILNIIETGDGY